VHGGGKAAVSLVEKAEKGTFAWEAQKKGVEETADIPCHVY
jgi:hypothetical protein